MGKHGKKPETTTYLTVSVGEGHPLAQADGRTRVHRLVLFDAIGPGAHPCHWCQKIVHWEAEPALVADHLDGNTWNNDPGNLVPACFVCNIHRAPKSRPKPKQKCHKGHDFTEENTYYRPDGKGRQCRTCNAAREAKRERVWAK